jgi:hypothetical protein
MSTFAWTPAPTHVNRNDGSTIRVVFIGPEYMVGRNENGDELTIPASEFPEWGDVRHVAVCTECERVFDLTDETDNEEWHYGHDCEA